MNELRLAFRRLRRRPGRGAATALALAVGIGATTAAFAAVDHVLLRELPVEAQDDLVVVRHLTPERGSLEVPLRPRPYEAVARGVTSLSALAGFSAWGTMPALIESVEGDVGVLRHVRVAGDFFGVLGARPAAGRLLRAADDRVGAPPVAVLSHGAWTGRYAADPDVIGSTLVLDGVTTTVVGVAPEGLDFPHGTELWRPYRIDYASEEVPHELHVVGRLAAGATSEIVAADVGVALRGGGLEDSVIQAAAVAIVRPFVDEVLGSVRPIVDAALVAAILLLVVAVANATLFLLGGGRAVVHDLAVRRSLGAQRSRLLGRVLSDAVAVSLLGGAAGLAIAAPTLRFLLPLGPSDLPRLDSVALDWRAAAFGGLVALASAAVAALAATAALTRLETGGRLLLGGRVDRGGRAGPRRTVAGAQVALAAASALGAALLLRTVESLNRLDPGLAAADMTAVTLRTPYAWFQVPEDYLAALDEVVRDLESRPGVMAARPTLGPPLEQRLEVVLTAEGQDEAEAATNPYVAVDAVLPGHFEALGISLLAGRGIVDSDNRPEAAPVVVVDEVLAGALWPGEDPIGRRLNAFGHIDTWFTVVGVARATRYRELLAPHPRAYYPLRRLGNSPPAALLVRADPAEPVADIVREAFGRADPRVRVMGAQPMEDVLRQPTVGRRFAATVLAWFAAATLLLAALGVYGVLTISVEERRREMGVRKALGARRPHLVRLVLGTTVRVAATGAVAGLLVGAWASRFLESLLWGVAATDPATFAAVLAGCLVLALGAGVGPALRASHAAPAEALRE